MHLGSAAGEGRALIVPTGGENELTVESWSEKRPGPFAKACRRAYEIEFGHKSGNETDSSDSTLETFLLGGLTALLGSLVGYWLGNRASWKQRRYQEGVALGDDLSSLDTAISRLITATEETTATGEATLLVGDSAVQLRSRIRTSARQTEDATAKIDELRGVLRRQSPGQGQHQQRADDLKGAWEKARTATETVVAAIQKEAAISWLSRLLLRLRGK
ncbi:MAG TPA: hypothetical protein VIY71_08755 [Solirubrobacterales bacterium]